MIEFGLSPGYITLIIVLLALFLPILVFFGSYALEKRALWFGTTTTVNIIFLFLLFLKTINID